MEGFGSVMTAKVLRAEKILDRVQQRTGMSDDGKKWLIAVLDPMHDEKIDCNGYPDRETNPSVVHVIKQSTPVQSPFANTKIWGFHAFIDDYLLNNTAVQTADQKFVANAVSYDSQGGNPTRTLGVGGLNIVYHDYTTTPQATDITIVDSTSGGPNQNQLVQLQIDPLSFVAGKLRTLSQGLEVVNTTPELYRGGSLAVYEQPTSRHDPVNMILSYTAATLAKELSQYPESLLFFKTEEAEVSSCMSKSEEEPEMMCYADFMALKTFPKVFSAYLVEKSPLNKRVIKFLGDQKTLTTYVSHPGDGTITLDVMPPMSLAEALLLPGTQQWDAVEGAYIVQTMNSMENPPSFPTCEGTLYVANELAWPIAGFVNSQPSVTTPFLTFLRLGGTISPTGDKFSFFDWNHKAPFNRKGVIVTGQQPSATFTLNYNTIIERIISSQDKSLATLAKTSPCEDYIATQLYSEICQKIPIGVKFKDNDFGDWFLGVVDQVADVVSAVGKPIMAATDMYKSNRQGTNTQGSTYSAPQFKTAKSGQVKAIQSAGKSKTKKSGQTVTIQGPQLPGGKFKSEQAKALKKGKAKK